ncbi:MAG: glycosyltransferase family 2 protein, partial [Gemmatimonadaceae bacterium]
DPPLPAQWIGKVWALQHGLSLASGEWVLGMDADTEAEPGMVAAVVEAARTRQLDVVSFSPRFDGQTHGERWLQPSMLLTLVYRCGAPTDHPHPDQLMANGQCFLARREVLLRHGGYELARRSFADDVTLARALAARGERVGFLDGSLIYRVRSYANARQMWREWGRSFDLTDATTSFRQIIDVVYILLVQGLPLPITLAFALSAAPAMGVMRALLWVNGALLGIRVLMTLAIAGSFVRRGPFFWLSPLSDPLAALRLVLSSARRPRNWRGRAYRTDAS